MRIHKKLKHLFKGFTLVELIVVISVLAVLASIAMSQVSNITAWARDSQRMTDMSAMKSSIELYKAKTGKLPIPTNGSGVTYSGGLLWTQGTFGEPTWRQLNSITPKPVDPNNSIEYVYSVANNNREFELGGILEKATGLAPSLFPELLAASQNVTFIEGTYNGVSLKVETGSKTYIVAAPSLIGGSLGNATMETTLLTLDGLGSLPLGFSGTVVSTVQTGTFTPVIGWSGAALPTTITGAEAVIAGLQSAYTGTIATSLSQISSLVSATGSQIASLGEGLVENALGGDISGESSGEGDTGGGVYCDNPTVVTTLYGNGTNPVLWDPDGVAVDSSNNVYVVDYGNNRILKITAAWAMSVYAGNGAAASTDGAGTGASFNGPRSITIDSAGNLFVVDYTGNKIRKIANDANKTVSTIAGNGTYGFLDHTMGTSAQFSSPMGITIDGNGNLYVADYMASRIRKIANNPNYPVTTIGGDGSYAYSDNASGSLAKFSRPWGLTSDSAGNIYVADTINSRIRKISSAAGNAVTTYAGAGGDALLDGSGSVAKFFYPQGIALDKNGNLFVVDTYNHRIRKIANDADHTVTTIAGGGAIYPDPGSFADGTGSAARFMLPTEIAIDSNGNLYVTDLGNKRVRKISCQ